MRISSNAGSRQSPSDSRLAIIVLGALTLMSVAHMSAHFVDGLGPSGSTSAFVSSPSDAADAPIQLKWGSDTGLRVACFHVANTSQPRVDNPGWPRVTAVGFEFLALCRASLS